MVAAPGRVFVLSVLADTLSVTDAGFALADTPEMVYCARRTVKSCLREETFRSYLMSTDLDTRSIGKLHAGNTADNVVQTR